MCCVNIIYILGDVFCFAVGFTCEEHENPADFFLDTIIHCEKQKCLSTKETVFYSTLDLEESGDAAIIETDTNSEKYYLVEIYRKSEEYQELRKTIDPVLNILHEEKRNEKMSKRVVKQVLKRELYATSFLWQVQM